MKVRTKIGIGSVMLAAGGLAFGYGAYRRAMGAAGKAYSRLAASSESPVRHFDPAMVSKLPEIAQRYFRHAIAPGTPLYSVVRLEMEGTFLLGDKEEHRAYAMSAREAMRPPAEFIWMPRLRAGVLTIAGSDALVDGEAWTRFWLLKLLPVANIASSPDMVRSAQFRSAVEGALWLPTTMLPENDVLWEQVGSNDARVTLSRFTPAIVLYISLDGKGAVREVVGQRWSNANREERFRLQPFGGTMSAETTFQGLTIPTAISVGNHYGTEDYLPFFQARITEVTYE